MSWRQYRKIENGEFLLFGVDTCSGGGDSTACQVISKTKTDVPLVFHSQTTTSDFINELVRVLEAAFDLTKVKPVVALERNNGGSFLMDRVAAMNFGGKFDIFKMPNYGRENPADSVRLGWDTNSATRPKGLQELKDAVDKGILTIYDPLTIEELLSFVVVKTTSAMKAQAERGSHDDLVMALMIAWQLYMISAVTPVGTPQKDYSKYENYKQDVAYNDRGYLI